MFAFSRGLGLLNRYLGGWFDSVLPPPSDQPWLNPFSIAMQIAVTAAAVFALIYMARGLVQARLYADQPGTRRWWALVALVAAVSSVMTAFLFSTMSPELEGDAFASYYWLTLLGVVLNVATVSAWAYFTGIAIAGRRAGEDPSFGWFLVAFAGSCILATFVISGMVTVMNTVSQPESVPNVLWLITSLPAIAYLALLAAFALRLPTTHAPLDEPDEEEAGAAGPAGSDDPSEPIAAPDDLAGSTA